MPIYAYECPKCRIVTEVFVPKPNPPRRRPRCPNCMVPTERSFQAEFGRRRPVIGKGWPMYSDALAVHPEQIADAERVAAENGVDVEYVKRDCPENGAFAGQAIVRSREHQRQLCDLHSKRTGMRIHNKDDYW